MPVVDFKVGMKMKVEHEVFEGVRLVLLACTAVISIWAGFRFFVAVSEVGGASILHIEFAILLACGFVLSLVSVFSVGYAVSEVRPNLLHGEETCIAPRWCQFLGSASFEEHERVFCIGGAAPTSRAHSLSREVAFSGRWVDLCDDFEVALEAVKTSPVAWSLLLIDIDHVEAELDIEDIVVELIDFRKECSSVAIVLLSRSFAKNDSSLVRSSISDYCFKSSVSNASIISSFPEIFENYQSWVGRASGGLR